MPTILVEGPYRFFFYSNDRGEPPHVHVERDERRAKFWLRPVRLAENLGFGRVELNRVQRLVELHEADFLGEWDAFFGA